MPSESHNSIHARASNRKPADFAFAIILAVVVGLTPLALVLKTCRNAAAIAKCVTLRNETGNPESSVAERSLAVAKGEPLYGDPTRWPYNAALYGPLTYCLTGWTGRLMGLPEQRLDQAQRVFVVGRVVSIVAGLAVLWWFWFMAGRLGLGWEFKLFSIVLFLASRSMVLYWPTHRPDFAALALALWGWAAAVHLRGRAGPLAAAALMALAFFFKQPCAVSAGFLALWLLATGRKRDAVFFSGIYAALLLVPIAALQFATQGRYWLNTVGALSSPFRAANVVEILFVLRGFDLLPFAGGLAVTMLRRARGARTNFACWAFCSTFVAAVLLSLRSGSALNYFLEPFCWGCLLCGAGAAQLLRKVSLGDPRATFRRIEILAVMVVLFVVGLWEIRHLPSSSRWMGDRFKSWGDDHREIADFLAGVRGEILTTKGYAYWHSNSPPTMLDSYLLSVRVETGALSPAPLIEKIRRHDFEAILLDWNIQTEEPNRWQNVDFMPREATEAILEDYSLDARSGKNLFLYVPIEGVKGPR